MDSGLGGLTVVRELSRLLPEQSLVYFGDNANCPYGNRSQEEILKLSFAMLDFLRDRGVSIAAVACNTISTLIKELRGRYDFPIVSIIEEACKYTAGLNLTQVGVFATEFTIRQGLYETLLRQLRPEIKVYGVSSRTLAGLVDEGRFNDPAIDTEVRSLVNSMQKACPELKHVILGCTHYPIVQDLFEKAAPGVSFINPAVAQALAVKELLSGRGLLSGGSQAGLDIRTSGEKQIYEAALKKLDIRRPVSIHITKKA